MYRIYFDGNDQVDFERYALSCFGSRKDLGRIVGGPQHGMMVTIYMTGEIEMEAILEWDKDRDRWTARPIAGTCRDNHETWK